MRLILDIDKQSLTALVLKTVLKKTYIKEYQRIFFNNLGGIKPSDDLFDAALTELETIFDFSICSSAVLLIPSSSVSFRNIEFPFLPKRKIKQILPLEIESYLPAADISYVSDFKILGQLNSRSTINVFTASAPSSDIEHYLSVLNAHGLKADMIAPRGYITAKAIQVEKPQAENYICLDLSRKEHTITLIHSKEPYSVYSFPSSLYPTEKLSEIIKQTFLGFKQNTGLSTHFDVFVCRENKIKGILKLYRRLDRFIKYQKSFSKSDTSHSRTLCLKEFNSSRLITNFLSSSFKNSAINLCTQQSKGYSFAKTGILKYASTVFLLTCLLCVSLMDIYLENSILKKNIAKLKAKNAAIVKATFPEQKQIKYPLLQMQRLVEEKINESRNIKTAGQSNATPKVVEITSILSESIPASVKIDISKFNVNKNTVVLSGTTDTFKNVEKIKRSIESQPLFMNVTINTAAQDKKTAHIRFKLTILLKGGQYV